VAPGRLGQLLVSCLGVKADILSSYVICHQGLTHLSVPFATALRIQMGQFTLYHLPLDVGSFIEELTHLSMAFATTGTYHNSQNPHGSIHFIPLAINYD